MPTAATNTEETASLTFLMVAAHPDDLDFSSAGTTATLTAQGHRVVYCFVTSGQAGGSDSTMSRERMAQIREEEQTTAAKVVGVTELHFLGFPDGSVEAGLPLRKAIARVIRKVRPDRVVTQSPTRNLESMYGSHPDHTATGEATLCAVYPDARNEFAFPELLTTEGLNPHTVPETWVISRTDADHFVDITDTFDSKVEALLCHQSQLPDPDRIPVMMREWSERLAEKAGFAPGRLAEGFRKLDTA